jgi:hypothetical protein
MERLIIAQLLLRCSCGSWFLAFLFARIKEMEKVHHQIMCFLVHFCSPFPHHLPSLLQNGGQTFEPTKEYSLKCMDECEYRIIFTILFMGNITIVNEYLSSCKLEAGPQLPFELTNQQSK